MTTEVDTPQILNCNKSVSFWLTWYAGRISIGKGVLLGANMFLDYQGVMVTEIQAVSFWTGVTPGGAQWQLPMLEGMRETNLNLSRI